MSHSIHLPQFCITPARPCFPYPVALAFHPPQLEHGMPGRQMGKQAKNRVESDDSERCYMMARDVVGEGQRPFLFPGERCTWTCIFSIQRGGKGSKTNVTLAMQAEQQCPSTSLPQQRHFQYYYSTATLDVASASVGDSNTLVGDIESTSYTTLSRSACC